MPYLRFSRDKRGYENTYVLHTYQRNGKAIPRLLYLFRTLPNLKIGRLPLDSDAIRAIEDSNPDLVFDWARILKVRPNFISKQENQKGSTGSVNENRDRRPQKKSKEAIASVGSMPDQVVTEEKVKTVALEAKALAEKVNPVSKVSDDKEDEAIVEVERQHPVVALMGDEMLAKIRARYAEIQLRIAEKFDNPSMGEEIRVLAEKLNPDSWVNLEEAVNGIERFESEAESIRSVLGRRRPRSRRGISDSDAN